MLRGAASASLALLLAGSGAASAQVAAGGLGTRVNGTALGRCSAGVCRVQGGSAAGPNLFHRFSQFDTRAGIQRVDLDSRGRTNVVVGVSHPAGSFFGAPLRLSGAANLFWLSPGGIWLGSGAGFQQVTSLLLSTAPTLRIGGGEFNAVGGLADRLEAGADAPAPDLEALARSGLAGDALASGDGPIVLAGGRLTVDRHLLLHSGVGPLLTAPGERSELGAGGSVQLSGGQIALQGLDVQAGTSTDDDQVRIRSGPVLGGGVGRLELTDASLRASRIQLDGPGGLALQQVEAHAGGAAEPGAVGIFAGTNETASAARLNAVGLEAGEVVIGARGPLEASRLRVAAGGQGGSGTLHVVAGASANETPSLRLDAASLQGRNVVINARGASQLENLQASAGEAGGVWITTDAGQNPSASPTSLRAVELRGDTVKVSANGTLTANDLTISGRTLALVAEAPSNQSATVRLDKVRLTGPMGGNPPGLPAERLQILSSGDLTASQLDASAETILLQAGGLLRLSDGGELQGVGGTGQVQLDALSPAGGLSEGQLDLRGINIQAQTITGRADRSVNLQRVNLRAGQPGSRGLVRLETAPPLEPIDSDAPPMPRSGTVTVEGGQLEGQWLLLRSGAIELTGSVFEAPKGIIQLEAEGGDIQLKNSRLDVGVRQLADLRREVIVNSKISQTLSINQEEPPPRIGLFSAGNVSLRNDSALLSNQNVQAIREANPGFEEQSIRLQDSSGEILVDAQQSLLIEHSYLEANATDNLAGDILLRSQSTNHQAGISLRNAWISASGGAGSGDLRLHSAGGIQIDNSHLLALANLRFEDSDHPGQPSPVLGFAGGEITLTNSSGGRGIAIRNSELNAEQNLTNKVVSGFKRNGTGNESGYFFDSNDYDDNARVYSGGSISILSDSGIQISGQQSLITVGEAPTASQQTETMGGIIRLGNTSAGHSINIDSDARLSAISNPSGDRALDARGRIHAWSHGPINLRDAFLDTSIYPQADFRSAKDAWRTSIALLSASTINSTNTDVRFLDPENISEARLSCSEGCSEVAWNPETHREFLSELFWGPNRRYPSSLDFSPEAPTRDISIEEVSNSQKTQFLNKSEDWLFVAGLPDGPTINNPPRPDLPADLKADWTGLATAPLPASDELTLQWPDPGRWDSQALLPSLNRQVAAPEPPTYPESPLTASDLRSVSGADAKQVFAADQDKALRAALKLLAPGRRVGNVWSVGALQESLQQAMAQTLQSDTKPARPSEYRPAILQISLSQQPGMKRAQINHILLTSSGDLQGWQSQVDPMELRQSVRRFQQQLSGLGDLGDGRAGQDLATVLIGPVLPELRRLGINALLLSLDRGLQGIPFAALPIGGESLADLAALTVTPALALTDLAAPPPPARTRVVLAGSSHFSNGLAPLPMARQELEQLANLLPESLLLVDRDFSPQSLLKATQQEPVSILHIASHADFSASSLLSEAKIYTRDAEIPLSILARSLNSQNKSMGLFVLNACRTAAGDERRELGIAGLALQTGAHSALGNLWYVDDVASTAFSLQFYHNLQQGLRRDQALQETQRQFRQGEIRVRGKTIINANRQVLVSDLNRSQQIQLDGALSHPYYWSGTLLSGSPW